MSIEKLKLKLSNLGVDITDPSKINYNCNYNYNNYSHNYDYDVKKDDDDNDDDIFNIGKCTIDVNKSIINKKDSKEDLTLRRPKKFSIKKNKINLNQKNAAIKVANNIKNEDTPMRSVLYQMKISEENWKREKAKLCREMSKYRLKAHKLELENKKLMSCRKHNRIDLKELKNAFINKEDQLKYLQDKINELENIIIENKQGGSERYAEIIYERDDLKKLLDATLKRLETVDDFLNKILNNNSMIENNESVNCCESNKLLKEKLNNSKKQLKKQNDLIRKLSQIQIDRNKNQKEFIKKALNIE